MKRRSGGDEVREKVGGGGEKRRISAETEREGGRIHGGVRKLKPHVWKKCLGPCPPDLRRDSIQPVRQSADPCHSAATPGETNPITRHLHFSWCLPTLCILVSPKVIMSLVSLRL